MTFKPKNMLEEIMGIHPCKFPNMSGKYNGEYRSKPMKGYKQFVFLTVLNETYLMPATDKNIEAANIICNEATHVQLDDNGEFHTTVFKNQRLNNFKNIKEYTIVWLPYDPLVESKQKTVSVG